VFGGLSCFKGKQIIRAFHKCRLNHGGPAGRCPNRILRYRCAEGQRSGVPGVQFNGRVACRRGEKKVVSTYTQNL
jgi:hypothetical protein